MNDFLDILTIIIPVKNEESNLPGCLENIRAFRNVIVVDSGSLDRTPEIAAEHDREVVQFKWNGGFPKKRNWVLRNYKFKTPWVMFLDADERITAAFCEELERVLPETKCNAFICFYDNWFMGQMLRHGDIMHKTAILRLGAGEYEKLDRLIRRMYAMGRSDKTNRENAVMELEKILDLEGDQRILAFKEFLNKSYYQDFERVDNETVFLLGISQFVTIFQSFFLYERNRNYWLKMVDFYFTFRSITEISAELIQCLNYCCIDDREVFLDIVRKFNELEIQGNLNETKCYALFLRKYIQKMVDLSGIRGQYWEHLMSNGIPETEVITKFKDIAEDVKSGLDELEKETTFSIVKEDCASMCSFIDKNHQLIQCGSALKESTHNISVHTEMMNPVRHIEELIKKGNLTGDELCNLLTDKYREGYIQAVDTQELWEKYGIEP